MRASACCSRAVCRPSEQRLDGSDISVVFEQVGREAVPQRMQRHVLLDPGRVGCLVEQAAQLAGRHRFAGLTAGKQPALLQRHARVPTCWAHLPPLSQQIEHLGRQHHVPILAALGLLDANNPFAPCRYA